MLIQEIIVFHFHGFSSAHLKYKKQTQNICCLNFLSYYIENPICFPTGGDASDFSNDNEVCKRFIPLKIQSIRSQKSLILPHHVSMVCYRYI